MIKGPEGLIYERRLKELNTVCIDGASLRRDILIP